MDSASIDGMELGLFKDIHEGFLEKKIKNAFSSMEPKRRLNTIMNTIGIALEAEERFNEFIAEAWELVIRERWWKATYDSFEDFKLRCGLRDSLLESIEARKRTEKRKVIFEAGAVKSWGGETLTQILGDELIPINPSKTFLETLRTLAQQINDVGVAKPLLIESRNVRLKKSGTIKDTRLQLSDVRATLERVKGKSLSSTQRATMQLTTARTIKAQKSEKQKHEGTVEKGILPT